jgi:hypothetical protein
VVLTRRCRAASPTAHAEQKPNSNHDRSNDRSGPALAPVTGAGVVDHAGFDLGGLWLDLGLGWELDDHGNVLP